MPRRSAAPPLESLLAEMAEEIEVVSGVAAPREDDGPPLWEPLEPQLGRGFAMPDGRVVSPQRAAAESLADELFFGGSGGGGKTDLLLGLALTQHRSSIIFRREFTQFRGAEGMIERSRQIVGLRGRFSEGHVWRDLPGGRALEFGSVPHEDDKRKYQGRPHDLKGFDELPEFSEGQYRFLGGWLRTVYVGQRTRIVSTGNPPVNEEGMWVIRYWGPWLDPNHPRPAKDGELRWYASVGDADVERPDGAPFEHQGRMVRPRSRTFIRASVEDNPHYMRTGYATVLDNLPEPLRSQLRHGDFAASKQDDPWQVIPTAWVVAAQARWTPHGGAGRPLSQVGNDPSRGGADEFVIARRHDNWVGPLVVHPGSAAPTGPRGAALVWAAVGGAKDVPVCIDIIGTAGSSVYDHCVGLGLQAVAMNASERTDARERSGKLGFVNKRDRWHWHLRELLDPSLGQDMALPPDPQLRSDLVAARWRPMPRGIKVEEKEEIIRRLGRSPDRGEAVMYACAPTDEPKRRRYEAATWR